MSKKLIRFTTFFLLVIFLGTGITANYAFAEVGTPSGTNRADIINGDPGVIEKDPNKLVDAGYLVFNIVFALAGIALAIFAIIRAFDLRKKDSRERAEGAMGLLYLAVAGILIFGVWFFIGIMRGIATKLGA